VEGNVVTTEVEYQMCFHGKRRGRTNKDWVKALVFFAIQALLCCTWFACRSAYASDSQVIVEGARGAGDAIRTSGHNVPLLRALEEVVPASYSVNVPNAGAWADVPVSWQAGGSLVHVLGEILSVNPSLQAHIDTDLALVTVSARAHAQVDDPAPLAAASAPSIAAAAAAPTTPAAASVAATTSVAPTPVAQDLGAHANSALAPSSPQTVAAVTKASTPSATPSVPPIISATSAPDSGTATSLPTAHVHSHVAPTNSAPVLPIAIAAPPPAQTQAEAQDPAEAQTEWQMRPSDGSVRNALARWAKEAGWQFVWDVPTDFAIDATATVHGTLEEALRQVVEALAGSAVPIQAVMYKRNRVLRVIAKGAN
jgi:hypothetical protein